MEIKLTVTAGPHKGRVFTFTGHDTFVVGRSKRANFRLSSKDRYFSRIHFMVEVNPPCCRLMDMASRNGVYVNGRKVEKSDLKADDRIRAGKTILRVAFTGVDAPAVPEPADLAATQPRFPEPICGYRIIRELGHGLGVVYLASRVADKKLVALKTITPASTPTRAELTRFRREAEILYELDHPNIVAFHDMGESQGQLYFAMDYVRGTDAGRLLKDHGPMPVGRALGLITQVLQALEYAHAKGFVHRDIKPSNILVTEEGMPEQALLADFGLARVYQASRLSGLTLMGDIGGTIPFMAPEQITDFRNVKPAADQYGVGAALYQLLTGRFPHDLPPKAEKQLLMILHEDPTPIRSRRPDIPQELAAVIHRALAREPQDRFADVKALRKALLKFV